MGLLDFGVSDAVKEVSSLLHAGIDKIWPDADAEQKRQAEQLLQEAIQRYSAITTEASSPDPWTSRARPSFMYVIYILLLMSIPFGICTVISPSKAADFVVGFRGWFEAIPSDLYMLFGAGYLGYATVRTVDKVKGVTK